MNGFTRMTSNEQRQVFGQKYFLPRIGLSTFSLHVAVENCVAAQISGEKVRQGVSAHATAARLQIQIQIQIQIQVKIQIQIQIQIQVQIQIHIQI